MNSIINIIIIIMLFLTYELLLMLLNSDFEAEYAWALASSLLDKQKGKYAISTRLIAPADACFLPIHLPTYLSIYLFTYLPTHPLI